VRFKLICIIYSALFVLNFYGDSSAWGDTGVRRPIDSEQKKPIRLAQAVSDDSKDDNISVDKKDEQSPTTAPATQPTIHPALKGPYEPKSFDFGGGTDKKIIRLMVQGEIEQGLAPFMVRVLEQAEKMQVAVVILDIDTPGGRVDAMDTIRKALLKSKVKTVAWVNRGAISAGAVIAYACDVIVFTTGATMGAATPITLEGGEAKPVGEKVVSYMRGLIRATAEAKGRSGDIAEAMVDKEIDLPPIAPKGRLLTVSTNDALKYGIADLKADSYEELLKKLNLEGAETIEPEENWAEEIARFLTSSTVSALLMTLGGLGILIGFYTGSPLALIVGVSCMAIFFLGHTIVHLAGWEEVLLFMVGFGLLLVEIFLFPGFGIPGIVGLICILLSLIMAMVEAPVQVSWETGDLGLSLTLVSIAFCGTFAVLTLFIKLAPYTNTGRRFVLATAVDAETGFLAPSSEWAGYLGKQGVLLSDCRPAGKARIEGEKVDVVSDGDFMKKGTAVEVIQVEGSRVVVRQVRVADVDTESS